MIKILRSKEYETMSKYDVVDILHKYLEEEYRIRMSRMLNDERTDRPEWAVEQQILVAQLKYIKKLTGFLPNKGKDDGR